MCACKAVQPPAFLSGKRRWKAYTCSCKTKLRLLESQNERGFEGARSEVTDPRLTFSPSGLSMYSVVNTLYETMFEENFVGDFLIFHGP